MRAIDVAAVLDRDPAAITRLEGRSTVDGVTARRFRRAVHALAKQRDAARRQLIQELVNL